MRYFLLLALLLAAPLSAELIAEFQDDVFLRDHETVRYRVDLDYGTGSQADVDILVRGFTAPPRVRVVDDNGHEVREVEDTDGDWTIEPGFTANDNHDHYFIEVDSANPGWEADFEVTISVDADPAAGADADISFDRFYFDRESGDDSDHYDCAATQAQGWPLIALATLASFALYLRRRTA